MPEIADAEERARRIEAGRLRFARPWRFVAGAPKAADLPVADAIEVAFAGRSNVGKSSLINALTGQTTLARTSNTPGRTRELNLFTADSGIAIVDMPGYGYARAPKTEVAAWTRTVFDYLRGRPRLRRVYVLVDARHGLKPNDDEALATLDKAAVSYQIVLTKADKVKGGGAGRRHRGDRRQDRQATGSAPRGAGDLVRHRRGNRGTQGGDRRARSLTERPSGDACRRLSPCRKPGIDRPFNDG